MSRDFIGGNLAHNGEWLQNRKKFPVDRETAGTILIAHFLIKLEPYSSSSMPEIQVKKGEPVDRALKRLKTKLEMEGILEEVRRLRSFETPKQRSARKARATAKRGKIRFRFSMNKPADKQVTEAADFVS